MTPATYMHHTIQNNLHKIDKHLQRYDHLETTSYNFTHLQHKLTDTCR